jgi:hypothetical protein
MDTGFDLVISDADASHLEDHLLATAEALTDHTVYFVRSGKFVKIGHSRDLRRRLCTVRTAAPERAWLIGLMKGDDKKEKEIQARFRGRRHRAEWYHLCPEILEFMRTKCVWPVQPPW